MQISGAGKPRRWWELVVLVEMLVKLELTDSTAGRALIIV